MEAIGVPDKVREIETQLLAPGSHFELLDDVIDGQPIQRFANRTTNIRELLERSVNFGDAEYLV